MPIKLSAIIVARDEEDNIFRCISSLRPLIDEFIVLDTGSEDRTVEVAEALGAQVFRDSWRDDWAHSNNLALSFATGDWVLLVDADEVLEDTDASKVREFLENSKEDLLLVRMPIRFLHNERWEQHSLRLLRRSSGARWIYPIHSQLAIPGSKQSVFEHSGVTLLDHGYSHSTSTNEDKCRRNLRISLKWLESLNDGDSEARLLAYSAVMKSYWGLKDWPNCVKISREIVRIWDIRYPSRILEEAFILGATSLIHLEKLHSASAFLRRGLEFSPENPDLMLLSVIVSLELYAKVLKERPKETSQMLMFRHDLERALRALSVFEG